MHKQFWLERWKDHRIGFHGDQPMPSLVRHWPTLDLPTGSRVLVPLAGKSLDMLWLATQGYRVLGVEWSPLAIEQFLAENALQASVHESSMGTHYVADRIELICADVFKLDDATLETCDAVYDRAAIIALPPDMREHYAKRVYSRLPSRCRGLMITLEYEQSQMDGPPFSVTENEVRNLLEPAWHADVLDRHDILAEQPRFIEQGLTALTTTAYRLQRSAAQKI